jgi:hypothetical protein
MTRLRSPSKEAMREIAARLRATSCSAAAARASASSRRDSAASL